MMPSSRGDEWTYIYQVHCANDALLWGYVYGLFVHGRSRATVLIFVKRGPVGLFMQFSGYATSIIAVRCEYPGPPGRDNVKPQDALRRCRRGPVLAGETRLRWCGCTTDTRPRRRTRTLGWLAPSSSAGGASRTKPWGLTGGTGLKQQVGYTYLPWFAPALYRTSRPHAVAAWRLEKRSLHRPHLM